MSFPIKIVDGCWICAGSTLLAGCSIENQIIIAAGSVVKDFIGSRVIWGHFGKVHKEYLKKVC